MPVAHESHLLDTSITKLWPLWRCSVCVLSKICSVITTFTNTKHTLTHHTITQRNNISKKELMTSCDDSDDNKPHSHITHMHGQMAPAIWNDERVYYVRHISVRKGLKFYAMKAFCDPALIFDGQQILNGEQAPSDTLNEYRYRHDFTTMHSVWNSRCPNNFLRIDARLSPLMHNAQFIWWLFELRAYNINVPFLCWHCASGACLVGGVEKRMLSLLHDWTLTFWPAAKFRQHFLKYTFYSVFSTLFSHGYWQLCSRKKICCRQ